jgi:hypothetical protein
MHLFGWFLFSSWRCASVRDTQAQLETHLQDKTKQTPKQMHAHRDKETKITNNNIRTAIYSKGRDRIKTLNDGQLGRNMLSVIF